MGHDSPHELRSTLARSFLRRVRRTGYRVVHTDIASTAAAKTGLPRRTGAPPRVRLVQRVRTRSIVV